MAQRGRDLPLDAHPPPDSPRQLPLDRRPAGVIHRYIAEHDADPKPFIWTKPANQTFANLNRLNASAP
jgi:hypothetical protein